MYLARPGIYSVYACGPALQKAVSEPAGGRANIEADTPVNGDMEGVEGRFQLQPAATYVAQRLLHFDDGRSGHGPAGLVRQLAIDQNFTGENQGLSPLARLDQLAFDEFMIEPLLHALRYTTKSAI
jgi:hypothetical protein